MYIRERRASGLGIRRALLRPAAVGGWRKLARVQLRAVVAEEPQRRAIRPSETDLRLILAAAAALARRRRVVLLMHDAVAHLYASDKNMSW